jgi:FkbM family methyltransferase
VFSSFYRNLRPADLSGRLSEALEGWRRWRREGAPGPLGDFYRSGGNPRLWRGLPLGSSSLAIDAGGYIGEWTAEIVARYGCRVIVFEPIPQFVATLRDRFGTNDHVDIRSVGLSGSAGRVTFTVSGAATSAFRGGQVGTAVEAELVDVRDVFASLGGRSVDCLALNIEGSEYDVLERMVACDLIRSVGCFVIQFHDVGPDAPRRRERAREALARTHRMVFEFPFVWERWDRREEPLTKGIT